MKPLITLIIITMTLTLHGQKLWIPVQSNPIELGSVKWHRSYSSVIEQSISTGKDILILFQEVPGCSTCTTYGTEIMSHPLIVEAIEENFVPLCIYNNRKGEDARVLKLFGEPSWNNPVVRIVDNSGKDIVPRLSGNYSRSYLVDGIIAALLNNGKPVPEYLNILQTEFSNHTPEELILGMYCFWSGEKLMAQVQGVTDTEAGFMGGKEVVKISYNPNLATGQEIINKAKSGNCANIVFDNGRNFKGIETRAISGFRKDKQSKYYLFHSPYKVVPMTGLQQLKANAELASGGDPTFLLSPRQLELLNISISKLIDLNNIGKEIDDAWLTSLNKLKLL